MYIDIYICRCSEFYEGKHSLVLIVFKMQAFVCACVCGFVRACVRFSLFLCCVCVCVRVRVRFSLCLSRERLARVLRLFVA